MFILIKLLTALSCRYLKANPACHSLGTPENRVNSDNAPGRQVTWLKCCESSPKKIGETPPKPGGWASFPVPTNAAVLVLCCGDPCPAGRHGHVGALCSCWTNCCRATVNLKLINGCNSRRQIQHARGRGCEIPPGFKVSRSTPDSSAAAELQPVILIKARTCRTGL